MAQIFSIAIDQLLGRASGPLHLRLIFQPVVASVIAIRAGCADARENRPAFLWTLVSQKASRRPLLVSAWKDIGKVFVIALGLDTIYQVVVLHWLYPLQTLMVAFVLAIVPYVVIRGPMSRVARTRLLRFKAAGPPAL